MYLDISFAIDPEVVLPLVIVPSSYMRFSEDVGLYPDGAMGVPSDSDFPAGGFPEGANPVLAGSVAYAYPTPDPTQQANM